MFSWIRNRRRATSPQPLGPIVIYHHIAKTGGTSLRKVVQANYKGRTLLELYGPNRGSVDWYQRFYHALSYKQKAEIQCIAAHSAHYIIPIIDRPFRVFTLIRDPVDRVISLYYFTRGLAKKGVGKGAQIGQALEALGWDLADIYLHVGVEQDAAPEYRQLFAPFFNGQTRAILGPHVDTAAMPIVAGAPEELMPYYNKLNDVLAQHYELGVTELYALSVRYFAQVFGWRRLFFVHKNRTKTRPKVQEFSDETIAMIRTFNQLDVTLHAQARIYLLAHATEKIQEIE